MKTIRLSYLSLAILGLSIFMNSCSSTQQFAGYYPENRITGKGIGQEVTQQKPQPPTTLVATTEKVVEADVVPVAAPVAEAKHQKGDRMVKWATKVTEKHMMALIAAKNGTSKKSFFGVREKFARKIANNLESKYGMDLNQYVATTRASIESAANVLSIVSFATGIAALVTYYGVFLFAPAAIATGIVGLIGIKRGGNGRKWMAICGIAFGAAALFLWSILFTFLFW